MSDHIINAIADLLQMTEEEAVVLQGIAQQESIEETATKMNVKPRRIKYLRKIIFAKLNVDSYQGVIKKIEIFFKK